MPGPLLVVDGPFLLYRSFFALPDSIRNGDGQPVNALLGAINALLRIAADRDPRAIVICFGAEAAHYRVELYPEYHATRPPVPDTLQWQFHQAREMFAAFTWEVHDTDTLEADDLLGSLATVEAQAGGHTLIVTGDRDMYQCVSDHASVLYLKSGIIGFEEVDEREVKRRYGVTPDLVPDFIALRGDPSDGLPGAKGIGPKTAADLLRQHGSLEQVLLHADDQRPRIAAALREQADALRAFRAIATLVAVDVKRPPDRPTDLNGGARAAREHGMNRLAQRLENAGSVSDL